MQSHTWVFNYRRYNTNVGGKIHIADRVARRQNAVAQELLFLHLFIFRGYLHGYLFGDLEFFFLTHLHVQHQADHHEHEKHRAEHDDSDLPKRDSIARVTRRTAHDTCSTVLRAFVAEFVRLTFVNIDRCAVSRVCWYAEAE
jgi:hypothetical protein